MMSIMKGLDEKAEQALAILEYFRFVWNEAKKIESKGPRETC